MIRFSQWELENDINHVEEVLAYSRRVRAKTLWKQELELGQQDQILTNQKF